jgi:propanol-preferring alcohol dehydrogenase
MAEKMLVDARNCFVLPDELAFADGAFIACGAGTTWSALQKVSPRCNDRAVVFGCGPLGLLGVLFLRAYGVEAVAVGRRKARLEKAREIGAADVIDIDESDDPGELLRSRYPGGFSLAYETSGAVTAQQWMIALLSRGGRAAVVGSGPKQPAISLSEIYGKQLSLHGSFVMNAGEYDNLCRFLVSQRTPLETLVSHRFPLAEAQQAFELADSGDCTKVMLDING